MKEIRDYAISVETKLGYEDTLQLVTDLLKKSGFGVLTEIDVSATLKQKIDVDIRPYKILGACNPPFAHRALQAEPYIGAFLPCNVVVWDEGDRCVVSAMNPRFMGEAIGNAEVIEVTGKIYDIISGVLIQIESQG